MGHASIPDLVPDPLAVLPPDDGSPGWLVKALAAKGISRRRFLQWCSAMTAAMALPAAYAPRVAKALETGKKPVMVWLEFQDCAGNTESMLRSSHPSIEDVVLDVLSLEYHETIMAGAGARAEAVLERVRTEHKGEYICVIEGAIPTADGGIYCTIGGRTALQIAQEMTADAALVLAVGACAWDGGFITQGPTGAKGVQAAVNPKVLVNLGGCPHNSVNTAAALVHYLTFGSAPQLDQFKRPLFAYGHLIHDQCERRAHFDAGRYVQEWGDQGHRNGWCLYKMGCKGPAATYNCPIVRWNDGTGWPIGAGHGCVACASPRFWDTMSPFYGRLPDVKMFGVDTTAQTIGLIAIGGVAVATGIHAVGAVARNVRKNAEVAADGTVTLADAPPEPPGDGSPPPAPPQATGEAAQPPADPATAADTSGSSPADQA
jgi:hydrogenase small subunit